MNLSLVLTPSAYNNSAPIHIGHMLSLLQEGGTHVDYIHYTAVPFYLYQRLLTEVVRTHEQLFPPGLLSVEERDLLERCILEKALGVRTTARTFQIDEGVIEELYSVAEKLMNGLVSAVRVASCDGLLVMPPTPNLIFAFIFLEKLREKDSDVPVMVVDYYNFDPVTPYLTAFLTDTNFYGDNIQGLLQMDPLYPVLREKLPQYADYIIEGEGYDVMQRLSDSQKQNIPGTAFSWNGKTYHKTQTPFCDMTHTPGTVTVVHSQPADLDSLPFPDYSLMQKFHRLGQIELTRGCPNACIFCERNAFAHSVHRTHSLEYALALYEHITQYQFAALDFFDSALNLDEPLAIAFLRAVLKEGSCPEYIAQVRGKPTSAELVQLMGETGCGSCAIGMETASKNVLADMHKTISITDVAQLIHLFGEHDIRTVLYTMVGFPTETIEDVYTTASFVKKMAFTGEITLLPNFYWVGPIQRLTMSLFSEYGIEYSPLTRRAIKSSSLIRCIPGVYCALTYTKGMDRTHLRRAIRIYEEVQSFLEATKEEDR